MKMKTVMIALAAVAMGGAANAITSEEIANALGVDPNIATFSLSGVSEWTIDSSAFHKGESSLKSGPVSVLQDYSWYNSIVTVSVHVKEACRMHFWYKTSCYNTSYVRL